MQIDSDVPAPGQRTGRKATYLFTRMEVGDSVFLPGEKVSGRPYMAAMVHGNRTDKQFTGRTRTEGGVKGIRIWRIK